MQQARLTQDGPNFADQLNLATYQRLAGDTAGAKVTAEQARNTLEPLYRNKPDNPDYALYLGLAYALIGEKDLALQLAERAVVLRANWKAVSGLENLAHVQTIVGENKRAISTLTQLLQGGPYQSDMYLPTALHRPFLGSIRFGTRCAPIRPSKNCARRSSTKASQSFRSKI